MVAHMQTSGIHKSPDFMVWVWVLKHPYRPINQHWVFPSIFEKVFLIH